MKKIVIYFSCFVLNFFIFPMIFSKRDKDVITDTSEQLQSQEENTNQDLSNKEQAENQGEYEYKQYGTLQLLHSKTGEVETVKLDEYLCNVVSAEMPADYELEALKAQAIVARTYTIYKINHKKHDNSDICDDSTCCQAWISKEDRLARWQEDLRESNWEKIEKAVNDTEGKVITYEHEPINAFFHSNSGGITEVPINVWGGSGYPYLQVVETAGEDAYSQYASEATFTQDELIGKLKTKYEDISIDFSNTEDIKILEYTDSGRVKTIKFGNHEISGVETRSLLGLRSANFEVAQSDGKITFSVKGYGHGVGMSQTGADAMAKQGSTAEDIIHHFYAGVEGKEVNEI